MTKEKVISFAWSSKLLNAKADKNVQTVAAVLHRKSDEPIGRDLFTVRTTGKSLSLFPSVWIILTTKCRSQLLHS